MQKIAIIIPCYNEEYRIDEAHLMQLAAQPEVSLYLANDGSRDRTLAKLTAFSARYPENCFVLDYKENEGKAMTICKSVNHLLALNNADYIGYFDADFSTPPAEIERLMAEIRLTGAPFIMGSRVLLLNSDINRKWHRHIIGRVIVTFINLKFKLGIYDTQCGAKIFSAQTAAAAFDRAFYTSWLFDVEVFLRLKKKGMLAGGIEFPLKTWRDVDGSKLSWKTGFKILREIQKLMRNY